MHQFASHDLPPLMDATLQCAQLPRREGAGIGCLQPRKQRLGCGIWTFLQPRQYFRPHSFEWVLSRSPVSLGTCRRPMGWACVSFPPKIGQAGQELLQALPPWATTDLSRTQGRQGRLSVTNLLQELEWIQPGFLVAK